MRKFGYILALGLAACSPPENPLVAELAIQMVEDGGRDDLPPKWRERYIECGVEALFGVPDEKVEAAVEAEDAAGKWVILGDDALDRFVRICRKVDENGPPPSR